MQAIVENAAAAIVHCGMVKINKPQMSICETCRHVEYAYSFSMSTVRKTDDVHRLEGMVFCTTISNTVNGL